MPSPEVKKPRSHSRVHETVILQVGIVYLIEIANAGEIEITAGRRCTAAHASLGIFKPYVVKNEPSILSGVYDRACAS
jgi:hypothetical protein